MDNFNSVLTTFLGLELVSCIAVYAGSESPWISLKIMYGLKMNKSLTGFEWHVINDRIFSLGELSL